MKPSWWPGEEHEQFTDWAISNGIVANGVGPARFLGRGLGMIALRSIQKDEAIVKVPRQIMLTVEGIPSSFTENFPEGTPVHVLLAAFLTNGNPQDLKQYDPWRKTWPSRKDFEDCLPILWPESLCGSNCEADPRSAKSTNLLPPSISGRWNSIRKRKPKHEYKSSHQNLLLQQKTRLRNAWDRVVAVFPDTDWESFSYHWLIVNTRSFHYLMPGQEPPEDRNDAMALLPFADYFNHSDVACNVKFDGKEYVFRATTSYEEGEEIFMSYGPHPNDFLFTEYGFYLDENKSESLYLDDIIFQDLSPSFQEELSLQKYYGNYQLTAAGVCYRTEIAACMKYMRPEDWQNYVLGYSTRGFDAKKSEAVIQEWITAYEMEAEAAITELERLWSGEIARQHGEKVRMLLKRWRQIQNLCQEAFDTVSG
ncbi:hypothetical protein P175DRAFT_0545552 [Aspergillus ochraceoroseus IBT 24754]|uniref:SET domain-containing protein n=3 Tax=Aspergillus subgen. Nidulantes TaxID=2720870 RepID=A0A0F8WLU1_9EURO|nr:uncharacterized protein P175DRAFT_0545552 [Aspergillus ochraceoroseus IBT 24754]KKK14337.1 hypothetical protein AOCH_001066 [Aspergillus ochraceoroseus]KKK18665.1 hypothetical protein ARAM_006457 [Aspergillus rambellii]PTU21924.1 hypothetical protein P175DRAFT_0545552 [Aspergillus ochraceoroseus IBT 24754]